jgi:hypothetical protein
MSTSLNESSSTEDDLGPIFPKIIYAIGELPSGNYSVVIEEDRGFSYIRELPDLSLEDMLK